MSEDVCKIGTKILFSYLLGSAAGAMVIVV